MSAEWEVLAIRFGEWDTVKADHYYRYPVYGEPDAPLHMDFYYWVLRRGTDVVLVDTGFHADALRNRPGRVLLTPVLETLDLLDIAPDQVSDVVVTHFHYDHTGNVDAFPNARFHVQRREFDFWTGPYGERPAAAATAEPREIAFLKEAHAQGRVTLLDGDSVVLPGISTKLAAGHCPGQQVVIVEGEKPIVLASDAMHFHDEMRLDRPFQVLFNLEECYETYDMLRSLEDEGAILVPGHDSAVMTMFEPISDKFPGLGVKIR